MGVVWFVTWGLWAGVVALDRRRQLHDRRWLLSLTILIVFAGLTRESMRDFDARTVSLCVLALAMATVIVVSEWMIQRKQVLAENWAKLHGFEPIAIAPQSSDSSLPEGLCRLPFFTGGRNPRTARLVRRDLPNGDELIVFDHSIRRINSWFELDGTLATGTVVALRRRDVRLPMFQVRPVGLFRWMDGGALGEAVSVSSAPSFAKSYRLGTDEPRKVRAIFNDELLAKLGETAGWLIEGEGDWVAAFMFDRAGSVAAMKSSTLRSVDLNSLERFTQDAYLVLSEVANRGARSIGSNADAA